MEKTNNRTLEYRRPVLADQGDMRKLTNGGEGNKEEQYIVWGNLGFAPSCKIPGLDE